MVIQTKQARNFKLTITLPETVKSCNSLTVEYNRRRYLKIGLNLESSPPAPYTENSTIATNNMGYKKRETGLRKIEQVKVV